MMPQQTRAIAKGTRAAVDRDNDVDEYERLRRDYDALQGKLTQLQRRYDELKYWAADMEQNFSARVNEKIEELLADAPSTKPATLSAQEWAAHQVDTTGQYIDGQGRRWINIADAARIKGVAYQTIYRAATGSTPSAYIESWTVGELPNGNARILVNPDTYRRGKRGKRPA